MTFSTENIERYNFSSSEKFLLDTNIWLYLYAPQPPKSLIVDIYSQALANMLKAKCLIYIDVLIISEFINRYARLRFDLLKVRNSKYKNFRRSKEFKEVAQDICKDVRRILNHSSRLNSEFESIDINVLLTEFGNGTADFNDQVLTELCKNNELKLITHDGDFRGKNIKIVTANKYLLNS